MAELVVSIPLDSKEEYNGTQYYLNVGKETIMFDYGNNIERDVYFLATVRDIFAIPDRDTPDTITLLKKEIPALIEALIDIEIS